MTKIYENWNGRVRVRPSAVATPSTEEELAQLVVRARAEGRSVKAVGSGHSFNEIMATTGLLVDMSNFDRVLEVDRERGHVRVQAGMKLQDLVRVLELNGLALPNIGAWMEQTISGVMATATHGTAGRWKSNLTDALLAYRLVNGKGEIVTIEGEGLRYLPLGYFGVVTEMWLRCVPLFNVTHRRHVTSSKRCIEELDEALENHDFVDLRFAGRIPRASLSTWDVAHARPSWRDRVLYRIEGARQYAINKAVAGYRALNTPADTANRVFHALGSIYMTKGRHPIKTAVWWKGLTFNSLGFAPAHDEFEFALPASAACAFLHEATDYMQATEDCASIEVQIRFSEACDIVLAPNRDRRTMWFNLNVFDLGAAWLSVEKLSALVREYGGRPHWCKCIPSIFVGDPVADIDEWEAIRRGHDPDGLFLNAYYERYLRPAIEASVDRAEHSGDRAA